MNLIDVNTMFSTDSKCRELLTRLRWPFGPQCPRCKEKAVELETDKHLFYCNLCDYQFSVTTGTIFNDTHLSLEKWFIATFLLCESKKGISACQIQRTVGISYKTAWYLCHRIRSAMQEAHTMLDGKVEIDETFIGGKPRRGRPYREKEVVFGIRKRNGQLRFIHAKDATAATAREIMGKNLSEDVEVIYTDESNIYKFGLLQRQRKLHKTIQHKRQYVSGLVHTNTIESSFSLLKRGIMGTWHNITAKHLPAYLNEIAFRFNRRHSPDLFVDTLRHMITADPLTFKKLTA